MLGQTQSTRLIMETKQREIKFRAWDKKDNRMIVHEQEFIPLKVTSIGVFRLSPACIEDHWVLMDIGRFELMQFTGLHDKNGKEIYEKDIIEWKYEYDADYDGDMPIVKTTAGRQIVDSIYDRSRILDAEREGNPVIVVGNIYETPELIK